MKVRLPFGHAGRPRNRSGRATALIALVVAGAVALAGWAFAEGELPLVSSSSDPTTTIGTGSGGASGDNVAVATNTKDGKTVFALSLKITQTKSSDVDPVNAAVAVASCEDCQTVAIALEAVLVAGEPDNFSPTNIALAINDQCSNCQTLATAYQQVVQNDSMVRISGSGRKQIADIRTDLQALRNSGLDIFSIQQAVNEAAARLTNVLKTEVFPIGKDAAKPADAPATTTTAAPAAAAASTTSPTTAASTSTTAPPESTTTTTTAPTTTTAAP